MRQAFERESELYRRDAAGSFFAGFVYGMLAALVVMLASGCWTSSPPPVSEPVHVRQFKPHRWSCDNLRSVSGSLPPATDLSECVWGDTDAYWSCASHKYSEEARALRGWALTALGVCEP